MKDSQVKWLDVFKQILLMLIHQLHMQIGVVAQGNLAHSCLP